MKGNNMKLKSATLALLGLMASSPVFAAEQTAKFSVPGMFCASCPFIVEAAMGKVEGVKSVMADAETRIALVVFDDAIATIEQIELASTNVGYEATLLDTGS